MRLTPDCSRCQFYAQSPFLVCAIHPQGVVTEQGRSVEGDCLDFRVDLSRAGGDGELWAPEGYFWYGDELIPIYPSALLRSHPSTLTQEERLEILDSHPIFTGKCPQYGYEFDPTVRLIHWSCPAYGWGDESV